jgi:hypothetical protein
LAGQTCWRSLPRSPLLVRSAPLVRSLWPGERECENCPAFVRIPPTSNSRIMRSGNCVGSEACADQLPGVGFARGILPRRVSLARRIAHFLRGLTSKPRLESFHNLSECPAPIWVLAQGNAAEGEADRRTSHEREPFPLESCRYSSKRH